MTDAAAQDRDVRIAIAAETLGSGAIPSAAAVAARLRLPTDEVLAAFGRLFAARVLILDGATGEILAFDPFSTGPTDFAVTSAGRDWWGICGWDALGIVAALRSDGTLRTRCGDCGEPFEVRVSAGVVDGPPGIVLQIGPPALQWWKDIRFT